MKRYYVALLVALFLGFSGCTTTRWQRLDSTPYDAHMDAHACLRDLGIDPYNS
jgi:hypothetical protein